MENKKNTSTNNIEEAFELPHKVFTEPFDLARINHELGEKAKHPSDCVKFHRAYCVGGECETIKESRQ